jgi:DNA-binding HxlR family transcriptional regulator
MQIFHKRLKTMKLKLLLKKNGEVLFEIPLSMDEWPKQRLETELTFSKNELEKFSKLFDALSHKTRLKMMKHLLVDDDLTLGFGEFMRDLGLNPKTVWESTRKLQEGGLLVRSEDGKYRASEPGAAEFLLLSLALRRLSKAMEEI